MDIRNSAIASSRPTSSFRSTAATAAVSVAPLDLDRVGAYLAPRLEVGSGPFLPTQDWSGIPRLDQGTQNSCGTTSLAMVLQFLTGRAFDHRKIDDAIRRTDLWGTAPSDLVRFAKDQGVPAAMYNRSSFDELKNHVANGRGVMVALDDPYSNGSDGGVKDHYVIVTGFEMRDGQEFVRIRDPNGDNNPNASRLSGTADYAMPRAEFERKWGKSMDGYENFMIVYGKPGDELPAERLDGVEHSIAIAESYRNVANNLDRIVSPEDFPTFVHGLIGAPGALAYAIPTAVGWGLTFVGDQAYDLAKKLPPGLREAGLVLATPFRAVGVGLSRIASGFSSAFDRLGGAAESLLRGDLKGFGKGLFDAGKAALGGVVNGVVDAGKKVVEAGKDVVKGAVDVVKDAGKAIASGVKKIFSGW